jgi:hypothetical protein
VAVTEKRSLVYLHNSDEFLWVTAADELEALVERISPEERETIDEKIGLLERMRDLVSTRSYEIEPINHSVRESQLDLFGSEDEPGADPGEGKGASF